MKFYSRLATSTHINWPFEDTISAFRGEFRRPLAALDRCTLNKGAFAFKIIRGGGGALKWPLKGESRLIEVAATAGLTNSKSIKGRVTILALCTSSHAD